VPSAVVTQVEALGVDAVQHVHACGQVRASRLDHHVVVRPHEAEGVAAPRKALHDVREKPEEPEAIVVVEEDHRAGDATRDDVEEPVRKGTTKEPRHPLDGTPHHAGSNSVGRNRHTLGTTAMPLRVMPEGLTLSHGPQGRG
jgi:hypothetical protein